MVTQAKYAQQSIYERLFSLVLDNGTYIDAYAVPEGANLSQSKEIAKGYDGTLARFEDIVKHLSSNPDALNAVKGEWGYVEGAGTFKHGMIFLDKDNNHIPVKYVQMDHGKRFQLVVANRKNRSVDPSELDLEKVVYEVKSKYLPRSLYIRPRSYSSHRLPDREGRYLLGFSEDPESCAYVVFVAHYSGAEQVSLRTEECETTHSADGCGTDAAGKTQKSHRHLIRN
jgi:hypothetical protein